MFLLGVLGIVSRLAGGNITPIASRYAVGSFSTVSTWWRAIATVIAFHNDKVKQRLIASRYSAARSC